MTADFALKKEIDDSRMYWLFCQHCHRGFWAHRSDAKYHTNACRQAAYRLRNRRRQQSEDLTESLHRQKDIHSPIKSVAIPGAGGDESDMIIATEPHSDITRVSRGW